MAHLVVESLVMAYSLLTRVSLLSESDFGCHSKSTDEKSHSGLKSERFDSKKYHVGI